MIQRIQTIFLAVASGSFFAQFGLPFLSASNSDKGLFNDLVYNISDNTGLLVVAVLGGLISALAIILFNNRPLQSKITYVAMLLGILLPVLAVVFLVQGGYAFPIEGGYSYGAGLFLPIVSIVLLVLAARFINKDEKLVRDSDRLR